MSFISPSSIRLRLALTLFLGFIVLLSFASISIYFISARILESDFDARLFAKAQAATASISQKGKDLDIDWNELPQELNPGKRSGNAIQLSDGKGRLFFKDSPLPSPSASTTSVGSYRNVILPGLGHFRVLTLPFVPRVEEEDVSVTPPDLRQPCILEIASNRSSLDRARDKLAVILMLMTGVTSVLSLGLVWVVLRQGLQPLNELGMAVAKVEAESLGQRIPADELPDELVPIAIKLNDLLNRLDVSFARERRFSADAAHELRTPVAELKTLSEVMLTGNEHAPEIRQAFQDTKDIAAHMESLVTVLLEMMRQEQGRDAVTLSDIDVVSEVQTAWKRHAASAAAKEIRLNFIGPSQPAVLRAEPRLLSIVLSNLFDNAVDYSPKGSVVDVEFHQGKGLPSLVISNPAENLVPADLAHLFERFWRKDAARGESNHFGLGLAITRTICQRMGTDLTASMEEGKRIRFWLRFSSPHPSKEKL